MWYEACSVTGKAKMLVAEIANQLDIDSQVWRCPTRQRLVHKAEDIKSRFYVGQTANAADIAPAWCKGKIRLSHTCYRIGLIPVYRQSAHRRLYKSSLAVGCHYFLPDLQSPSKPEKVTVLQPVPSYTDWWQRHIGVKNLPKVVMQLCPGRS